MVVVERWLPVPVPDWSEFYEVSDLGRVRSLDRVVTYASGRSCRYAGKLLRVVRPPSHRYVTVSLGKSQRVRVHQLVMLAFVGPCPPGLEVLHGNGNPDDNRLVNLRYGTHAENVTDTARHGMNARSVRTHCPRSHALAEPNLVAAHLRQGRRTCRACACARSALARGVAGNLQSLSDVYYTSFVDTNSSLM